MSVGIHEAHPGGDIDVVLDHDLFVDHKDNLVPQVHATADRQRGMVEQASADNIHLAEEVDVIADPDVGLSHHERHAPHAESLAHLNTSGAKQRLQVEISEQPAPHHSRRMVQVKNSAQHWIEEPRHRQIARAESLGKIAQCAEERRFPTPDFQEEALDQYCPGSEALSELLNYINAPLLISFSGITALQW